MPRGSLEPELMDHLVAQGQRGELVYLSCPPGMVNHISCYGLMTKKTPDGSRVIRYTTNAKSLLDDDNDSRQTNGPSDSIVLSHEPGHFDDLFCEFNHGTHELTHGSDPREYRNPDNFSARMNLAQLWEMAPECGLCSVLAQGVDRWRWIWQGPLNKYRYCDVVYDNRHAFPDGTHKSLFHAADEGYYDERFLPGPLSNEEVALYVSFSRAKKTMEVAVQKYPHGPMKKMTSLTTLEVFTDPDGHSPWPAIRPLPVVSENVLSESSLAKIQGWIHECVHNHELCNNTGGPETRPPTRLIEIKPSGDSGVSVRLIETAATQPYKYVALSHSWASSKPLKTDRDNYFQHKDEIPWARLSKVYQDTITLVKALFIDYVWIDSLCIIQQDADEWGREAHRMGEVYSNAFLVFVALGDQLALEKDPIETFTISGSEADTGKEVYQSTINVRRKIDHDNLVNSANDDTAGEWFSRGWCFQERLFATRLLHFGGSLEDISFECNTHLTCECGGVRTGIRLQNTGLSSLWCHAKAQFTQEFHSIATKVPDQMDEDSLLRVRDQLLAMYIALCEDFSSKNFTFPDDALPAMDSLASKLGPYLGNYHAGIWEHNILIGMQWESFNATRSRRYAPCCAPSFSWASRTGGAVWYFSAKELLADVDQREFSQVLAVHSSPANPLIPYGKTKFSAITLRGWAKPAMIEFQAPDEVGRMYLNDPDSGQWVQLDTQDDIDDIVLGDPDRMTPVLCFQLMRSWATSGRGEGCLVSAIVLSPANMEQGLLRRIGFAILERDFFDEEAMFASVTIV